MIYKNKETKLTADKELITVDDSVIYSITKFIKTHKCWTGTMTELGSELVSTIGRKKATNIPKYPNVLRRVINKMINRIRRRSISIAFNRSPDRARTRLVTIQYNG